MQAIFEEAIKFAFKDRNWILKILIGGILGLIPVVNVIFIIGYSLVLLRDSVDNKPAVLPEWSGWMDFGKNGSRGLLVLLFYGIPAIILGALATVPAIGKAFYALFILANLVTLPLFTLALIAWHKQGTLKSAFAVKDVWKSFAKDAQNYLIVTLVLAIPPLVVSLIFHYVGYGTFGYHSPVLFFPGAFLQLVLGCLWFWLGIVGARVFGQMHTLEKK